MAQPTRGDVHVNRPLTMMSIAYIQKAADFIANKVFPAIPVMKQADRYFVYTKDDWFKTRAQKRAPASESAGSGFALDNTPTYFADVFAVHMDVDDQTRANQDQPIDLDRDATMFVTQQMMLRREISWVSNYLKASTWTGASDFTPGTLWSSAGSDPMKDVYNLQQQIKAKTGFLPNTLVLSNDVHFALLSNAAVLDRIKYTQRGIVTADLLAALFGVEKYLVASAVVDTAADGAAFTGQYLAVNQGLLAYSNPSPSILQPSAGYTFSWQGLFGAGAEGNRIKTFRMEHLEADRIEGEMAYDMKLVGADLGCYLTGLIA